MKAFSKLKQTQTDVVAVLCGPGVAETNEKLVSHCRELELTLREDIYLLGLRHDVPRLLAGCDLFVLHSAGEAFPNALLQAMACGCLCVSTDVGDARRILGNGRYISPPGDAEKLSLKMDQLLTETLEQSEALRAENRRKVQKEFDIQNIICNYEERF